MKSIFSKLRTRWSPGGDGADEPLWIDPEARDRAEDEEALRILRGVRRVEITSRRLVQEVFAGEYHSAFKGQGIEFSGVREYVPGDDVRLIDRNVSARMQHPYIKIFHEERELSVVFLVDQSGSTRFGSGGKTRAEVMAELVAVLAFSAVSNGDKVGGLLFTETPEKWVAPRKGRRHVLRLVREVLFRKPEGRGTSLAAALEMAVRVLKRRSLLFILSDFHDTGYETALSIAARRHEVVPMVLVDPLERRLPDVGLIELEDLESGRRRLVDTSDPEVRRAHEIARRRFEQEELPRRLRGSGESPMFLPLDGDYIEPLHRSFRARMRRRARTG
ncbi:MAG: DUF58 domain-containing protein [Candidatus Eisenbacteria bacterium]|nr:DUF58 domain-containing protein [Candidatus Eisenbacteria bacterium]MCC7143536.1 DUF58 domain-containing protein [Candidatus Eisenbacteria bacterium]